MDAIKDAAVEACDDIHWKPDWGKDRMISMITRAHRLVHLPPADVGRAHPHLLLRGLRQAATVTAETIDKMSELFRERRLQRLVVDQEAEELMPAGRCLPECGCTDFTKETDIMDVWFDSGST